jgi:hypothetical protein
VVKLIVHEVDARRWPDFERLFESRGGPKACWCMVWRARGAGNQRHERLGAESRDQSTR